MVRFLPPDPAGFMAFRVRDVEKGCFRLHTGLTAVNTEVGVLQAAGATPAVIDAHAGVAGTRGRVGEAYTGLLRACGENPALRILRPS